MTLSPGEIEARVGNARFGILGTLAHDGRPHLVPVTYAFDGHRVYIAVDHKPKRTRNLQRLHNIERDPRVSFLVEHHDEDWTQLWWCRLDGSASVHPDGELLARTSDLLAAKYKEYARHPPTGPAIIVEVTAATGWHA